MKKFLIAAAAVVAVMFASCEGGAGIKMFTLENAPEAKLENDVDTISYLFGKLGVKYNKNLEVDTTYLKEFLEGVLASSEFTGKDSAYINGVLYGLNEQSRLKNLESNLFGPNDTTHTLNVNDFLAGIINEIVKGQSRIDGNEETLQKIISEKLDAVYENTIIESLSDKDKAYKKQNDDYMANIAKKAGIKSLGDGVYYEIVTEGKGAVPTESQVVKVHYEGKTIDGHIFDSSYQRNEAHEIMPTQVIAGWTKALTTMPVGSKWIIYIPYKQGYGPNDYGPIKGFSTMIFTIELLEIINE